MQKILDWLDKRGLLDPLEHALEIVATVLFTLWCIALLCAAGAVIVEAIMVSPWWLLAYIPLLVLAVLTLTVYFYITEKA